MKYYAVKIGKKPGIYDSWDIAKENVIGFEGAVYKSFSSLEDAKAFLADEKKEDEPLNKPTAYIDGSFNQETGEYSFGAVLFYEGKETRFKKKYPKDEYSVHRNVAGEIKGAGFIINYCINHGIKDIDIYYDYEGIHSWYAGLWKAKTPIAVKYAEFASEARNKINVNFIKVKSHTNVYYNDVVDSLAKEALGLI
ncbi:MAG: ribonuclease H family protein [Acholeplasmatales bacterium]|nr:ribonuclease H family protein [Acholeplasmatales bacterium]